jgi:hypothetical protein
LRTFGRTCLAGELVRFQRRVQHRSRFRGIANRPERHKLVKVESAGRLGIEPRGRT